MKPMSDEELAEIRERAEAARSWKVIKHAAAYAHETNADEWYKPDVTALLAEVARLRERLHERDATLMEIARAVANGPVSHDGFGDYTCNYCGQEFMSYDDPDDDAPGAIEHTSNCPVTQARALLTYADARPAPEKE